MVGLGRYEWYQSRSPTSMWGFVPFDPIMVCLSMGGVYHISHYIWNKLLGTISMDFTLLSGRVFKP